MTVRLIRQVGTQVPNTLYTGPDEQTLLNIGAADSQIWLASNYSPSVSAKELAAVGLTQADLQGAVLPSALATLGVKSNWINIARQREAAKLVNPFETSLLNTDVTFTQDATITPALSLRYSIGNTNTLANTPILCNGGTLTLNQSDIYYGNDVNGPAISSLYTIDVYADKVDWVLGNASQSGDLNFRVAVDGKFIKANQGFYSVTITSGNDGQVCHFLWSTIGWHRIQIERRQNSGVGSIYVAPATSRVQKPLERRILAYFLGNSYDGGTGPTFKQNYYVATWARAMGWDTRADGEGGSGYIAPGTALKVYGEASRIALLAAQTGANAPDIVVMGDEINDAPLDTAPGQPTLTAALLSTWQAVRIAQPKALIIVQGCNAGATGPSATRITTDQNTYLAFQAWGDPNSIFLPVSDTSRMIPKITGTGTVAAPNGTGNSDTFIIADGTHLTDAGGIALGTAKGRDTAAYINALAVTA